MAAIALPQYQKAVEKSKSAEALMNIATMKKQIEFYITANGVPNNPVYFKDFSTVELSGGEWDEHGFYITQNFLYACYVTSEGGYIDILRLSSEPHKAHVVCMSQDPDELLSPMGDGWQCGCFSQLTDTGRKMCKSAYEPLGFKYIDDEW